VTDPVVFRIAAAEGDDGEWAARPTAASGPWITLGRGLDHCRAACQRPECHLFVARHFLLCVSSFNARAQAFYTRHGYRQVGQFDDYVIDGASELLLYKRVQVV
jgi:hypothetical protein